MLPPANHSTSAVRSTFLALAVALTTLWSAISLAGAQGYICEINEVRVLSDEGTQVESEDFSKQFVGRNFSIDRTTGAMIGMPFSTSAFKSISVLNAGSEESSYKAMAQSEEPGKAAMYMYVAEHLKNREKPFWGTANGTQIYSGICE